MTTNKDDLTFSKRYGFEPVQIPFQTEDINQVLRTELWNGFYIHIYSKVKNTRIYENEIFKRFHEDIWSDFFKNPIDDFPIQDSTFSKFIRQYIENEVWYKVYEFFEFISRVIYDEYCYQYSHEDIVEYINTKLRENNSAYTLFENKFIPIITEIEISELNQTKSYVEEYELAGIQEHLKSAIELISQKPKPDFRNSIKESISMVEVISRIIEPSENTLGKALNKLDKNQKINRIFKAGFEKLYTYTNDKNGIRHALMDEQTVELEDARFFLISCSAFTNYLIEKAKKENLLNSK